MTSATAHKVNSHSISQADFLTSEERRYKDNDECDSHHETGKGASLGFLDNGSARDMSEPRRGSRLKRSGLPGEPVESYLYGEDHEKYPGYSCHEYP